MEDRGTDIHNFSASSSPHRLPTVSGVEALQQASHNAKGIPSGLPTLDGILLSNNGLSIATPGIRRGCVTEVFGPPGVGKTTFALQVVANALRSSHEESHVLWVNTGSPLVEERLHGLMQACLPLSDLNLPSSPPQLHGAALPLDEKYLYLEASTLPHLLTIFLHPTQSLPSSKTCLIVVDDLSNLLLGSFSRNPKNLKPSAPAAVKEKLEKQAAGRRFQIIENLAAAMSKMAALRNVAILVVTNATMSLKNSQKATLKPALSSQAWDSAIHTRVMLYRDFPNEEQESELSEIASNGLRYAEVQRLARKDVFTNPVPFVILAGGLRQLSMSSSESDHTLADAINGREGSQPPDDDELPLLPAELSQESQSKKRKAIEIADSEDEGEIDPDIDPDTDEPELPSMNTKTSVQYADAEAEADMIYRDDEMILETHETALLRRHRYARIRGSEDAVPVPSSEADGDEDEVEGDIEVEGEVEHKESDVESEDEREQ